MDHLGQVVRTCCVNQRLFFFMYFCLPFIFIFAFGDEGSDSEFEELECRRLFDCIDHPESKVLAFVLAFEFVVVIVFEIVIGGTVLFDLLLIILLGLFG